MVEIKSKIQDFVDQHKLTQPVEKQVTKRKRFFDELAIDETIKIR